MASVNITDLTAATDLTDDDLAVIVDDPSGTPVTKKITGANLGAATAFSTRYAPYMTFTSATRPAHSEGRIIYETDTNKLYISDGSAWNLFGGSGWTSYTPSWTNLTVGNGTQTAAYRHTDGGMWVRGLLTFGTTTSISGSVLQTVPNSETIVQNVGTIGHAVFFESGVGTSYGSVAYETATTVSFGVFNAASTYLARTNLSSMVPFTWGTSDTIQWLFFAPL